jgi:hypothetical protein
MVKVTVHIVLLCALVALVGCSPRATATPEAPTAIPATATPVPTSTPIPSPTPFPTASEPAPEATFTEVGNTATFSGTHGVAGTAIVAGLQTLIIQGFAYDGKGSAADIRLVLGEDYANPATILLQLEQREYKDEMLYVIVPASVGPGSADSIAVYNPDTGELYASQRFQ